MLSTVHVVKVICAHVDDLPTLVSHVDVVLVDLDHSVVAGLGQILAHRQLFQVPLWTSPLL